MDRDMMDGNSTIGTLAKRSGVSVETVRYYQRRGLLEEPPRPPGGVRRYPPEAVRRVRFIKRAQSLGFTLDEIAGLFALEDGKGCRQTREMAAQKLALIEEKIAGLSRMKRALADLVRACDASALGEPCPIIRLLVRE